MFNPEQFNPANPKKPEEIKPEEQDQNPKQEQEGREEMIKETRDFDEVLKQATDAQKEERHDDVKSLLQQAEDFLNQSRGMERYAKMPEEEYQWWLDQQQRKLFRAYRKIEDWDSAKKIVLATKGEESRKGRIECLEKETGKKFEET